MESMKMGEPALSPPSPPREDISRSMEPVGGLGDPKRFPVRAKDVSTVNVKSLLLKYMKYEKIDQATLARRLGATEGMVSKWVRGIITPSLRYYLAIERLLKS
jgi:hypothetical protein